MIKFPSGNTDVWHDFCMTSVWSFPISVTGKLTRSWSEGFCEGRLWTKESSAGDTEGGEQTWRHTATPHKMMSFECSAAYRCSQGRHLLLPPGSNSDATENDGYRCRTLLMPWQPSLCILQGPFKENPGKEDRKNKHFSSYPVCASRHCLPMVDLTWHCILVLQRTKTTALWFFPSRQNFV